MSEIGPVRPMNASPLSKVSYSVCNLRFVFEPVMGGFDPKPQMSSRPENEPFVYLLGLLGATPVTDWQPEHE
jgi:hypothetical protein